MIQDAQDATQTTSNKPVTVASVDANAAETARVNQQAILPTAVQTRFLSQLITGSNAQSNYIRTPAGRNFLTRFTVTNDQGQQVLAIPDTSVYIGIVDISNATADNEWPRVGFDMHTFPISFNSSDWGFTNGINQVATVTGYNNTGSDQDVLIVTQWRVIVQPASTAGTQQSNS